MGAARSGNRPARRPTESQRILTATVASGLGRTPEVDALHRERPGQPAAVASTAVLFPAPSPPTMRDDRTPADQALADRPRARSAVGPPGDPARHAQRGVLAPRPAGTRLQGSDEPVGGPHRARSASSRGSIARRHAGHTSTRKGRWVATTASARSQSVRRCSHSSSRCSLADSVPRRWSWASQVECLSTMRSTRTASSCSGAGTGSSSSWEREARYAASIGSQKFLVVSSPRTSRKCAWTWTRRPERPVEPVVVAHGRDLAGAAGAGRLETQPGEHLQEAGLVGARDEQVEVVVAGQRPVQRLVALPVAVGDRRVGQRRAQRPRRAPGSPAVRRSLPGRGRCAQRWSSFLVRPVHPLARTLAPRLHARLASGGARRVAAGGSRRWPSGGRPGSPSAPPARRATGSSGPPVRRPGRAFACPAATPAPGPSDRTHRRHRARAPVLGDRRVPRG